jgi:hypothetical protein
MANRRDADTEDGDTFHGQGDMAVSSVFAEFSMQTLFCDALVRNYGNDRTLGRMNWKMN